MTEQPVRHRVLAVRLSPAGAYAVLATPMAELADLVVDLHDVIGRAARELVARCRDARSVAERFQIVAAWIAERLGHGPAIEPSIAWVARRIAASGGTVPIATLRTELGVSKTRFTTTFRRQIGLTPKVYARVVRFRRLLGLLHAETQLTDAALAAGYYDQPHMNTEFRALAGLPPREFLAAFGPAIPYDVAS